MSRDPAAVSLATALVDNCVQAYGQLMGQRTNEYAGVLKVVIYHINNVNAFAETHSGFPAITARLVGSAAYADKETYKPHRIGADVDVVLQLPTGADAGHVVSTAVWVGKVADDLRMRVSLRGRTLWLLQRDDGMSVDIRIGLSPGWQQLPVWGPINWVPYVPPAVLLSAPSVHEALNKLNVNLVLEEGAPMAKCLRTPVAAIETAHKKMFSAVYSDLEARVVLNLLIALDYTKLPTAWLAHCVAFALKTWSAYEKVPGHKFTKLWELANYALNVLGKGYEVAWGKAEDLLLVATFLRELYGPDCFDVPALRPDTLQASISTKRVQHACRNWLLGRFSAPQRGRVESFFESGGAFDRMCKNGFAVDLGRVQVVPDESFHPSEAGLRLLIVFVHDLWQLPESVMAHNARTGRLGWLDFTPCGGDRKTLRNKLFGHSSPHGDNIVDAIVKKEPRMVNFLLDNTVLKDRSAGWTCKALGMASKYMAGFVEDRAAEAVVPAVTIPPCFEVDAPPKPPRTWAAIVAKCHP